MEARRTVLSCAFLRLPTFSQQRINRRRYFSSHEHTFEHFVHIGSGTGFAQCIFVVKPDIHDQLNWAGGKAKEQAVTVRHPFFYAPPVGVFGTQCFAQSEIRVVGVGWHKLCDAFVHGGQQPCFGMRFIGCWLLSSKLGDAMFQFVQCFLEQFEVEELPSGRI